MKAYTRLDLGEDQTLSTDELVASVNYDKLEGRPFGWGGGERGPSKKGPGVRASDLAEGQQNHLINEISKRNPKIDGYTVRAVKNLVQAAINGASDDRLLSMEQAMAAGKIRAHTTARFSAVKLEDNEADKKLKYAVSDLSGKKDTYGLMLLNAAVISGEIYTEKGGLDEDLIEQIMADTLSSDEKAYLLSKLELYEEDNPSY